MRGKSAKKRVQIPDEKFNSTLVTSFISYVMKDGKKAVAREIVYAAMDELSKKTKLDALEALEKAVGNAMPKVEVRSRRVGGANFQVPVPVAEGRQVSLALRWIIGAARDSRKNTQYKEVLARELLNAFNNEGPAIKRKEEVLRMAEANRAFAQFA